jgi:hypothetical protein
MSSWDAPTGSWDSSQEPDESGGPDEQGYQQGEPTGGHHAGRGGEGRPRAGRRGLPGYEQTQNYDQVPGQYDSGSGYGQQPGYGQQGYGPGTSPQPSFGSGSGAGQMVRYGQRPADDHAFGSGPQDALGSGRSRTAGSGPLSSPAPQGPQATPSPLDAPATFGSLPSGPQRPLSSGPQDPLSSGPQSTFSSGPRRAIGSAPQSPQTPPVPQAAFGSGPQGVVGYGEGATAAYRQYGADDPTRSNWSDTGDQQGYGDQPGYGSSPGYGQSGYGQQASSPGSFAPGGFGGQPDQSRMGQDHQQDYQTEAYPQPGSEPSDYPQNGFSENGLGQNGFGPAGFGQDPGITQAYGTQPAYGQNGFVPTAPGAPGQDGYPQDPYTQDPYGPAGYGQQGFEQPAGPGYDDDHVAARGRAPRSRSGPPRSGPRSAQQLAGARMALYLAAAVVGVVVIVFLVIHLAKSGANKAATGSSTPSTGPTAATGSNGTNAYVFTKAAKVGSFTLNKAATTQLTPNAEAQSAAIVNEIKARGYGKPGKVTVGVYDLTPVASISSSAFRGISFVGYDGTFNIKSVIKLERSMLVSSRMVKAGTHGGEMVCGYNTSGGTEASQCVWVSKTTLGEVEFLKGEVPVKYPGASKLALEVRNAVEVRA